MEKVIKEYPPEVVEISAESIRKYAEGISEDNPFFMRNQVAPPLYATALAIPFTGRVLIDDEVNQGINPTRVVHGEQDSRIFKLVKAGDRVKIISKFLGREEKETGTIFIVKAEQYNENTGEKIGEGYHLYFIRGEKKGEKKKETVESKPEYGNKLYEWKIKVAKDQPIKYAEGSGDRFPIHTDENFARAMGFPTIILHGMCTMAFAIKSVVDNVLGGDPTKVKRARVRFSKPVLPEQTLTFTGYESKEKPEIGKRRIDVVAVNDNGEEVLKNAFLEIE
ncbi:MAG: MaoC/PaaZ C-terminal domain-containing protein [Candidatus Calescibacterium sp.]|nr:MaoC/PaaZ C-terminal domain-containing protein [Candidatus Calescibacterium sp.]MCX7733316.1 MaoC/PaaZ C-terminal domain-containing protein [bacterium]MDW8086762.1 MaoC/PaaZ C-terminal domain-containing protein [Candidatus Calescibacterium sp.]